MPSLRSRLFVFILRHRHLMRLQLKRGAAIDWDTSMPRLRAEIERGAGFFGQLPKEIEMLPLEIGDLHAEWLLPSGAAKDKVILYFHGGGYATGSCKAHRGIVAKFVKGSGTGALVHDYRLAPEQPFPAALDDSVAAYCHLLHQGVKPSDIVFVGDSAGGGLALATLLALKDKSIQMPAGTVALSPWTDVENTGESWETNAKRDTLSWKGAQTVFSKYYAGDHDPRLPLISPLYGDLSGLPPLLIYVGGDETLLSDSTRFAKKAKDAGVDVSLNIGEGMFHCYPACAPLFPEATRAMREICDFIRRTLHT